MKVLKYLLMFLAFILAVSCSKKPATYEQVIENGIRITKNTGVPADSTFKINLKEVGFIEMENEEDTLRLIQFPQSFDFDTKGNFYILDYQTSMIHKYDSNFKQVAVFGRKGQGPGEFLKASKILVRDDTLIVPDSWQWKINKLDLEGKYISDKQYEDFKKAPVSISKFGKKYVNKFYGSTSEEGVRYGLEIVSIFSSNFDHEKDLYTYKNLIDLSKEMDASSNGSEFTTSDSELYLSVNSKTEYKIEVYDAEGNKKRMIRKNHMRVKNSEEAMKQEQEMNKKYGMKFKTEFLNAIFGMHSDKYGRLWVSSTTPKEEKGSNYDIFKDDIFLNRVKIEVDEGYFITQVGEKIIAINGNNNIKIYEY